MFVVMVASECASVAQAGGLGEVVFGLSRELELRGNDVEVILPKYDCMRYDHISGLAVRTTICGFPGTAERFTVRSGSGSSRGASASSSSRTPRIGSSSVGICTARRTMWCGSRSSQGGVGVHAKSNKRPEVIHCHDWQTALVPVLLFEMYQHIGMGDQRVCYTDPQLQSPRGRGRGGAVGHRACTRRSLLRL